eukprot:GAHX01001546.1.p1 GENE.GAHX01001546.1~~GAHX01001546.1.p1  ORF type:complete len:337 (-),score=69.81 GAHX01001546.1:96-1106(-)
MFSLPWTEKYRPQTLDEFRQSISIYNKFEAFQNKNTFPNLILSGPPGTGKTTITHCLARAVLGEGCKEMVYELNASESRGIDTVRTKIKSFANKDVSDTIKKLTKNNPSLKPLKIIILDEVDNMTGGAQQALRRTMEHFANTTRFVLTCNISSKIIEPIQSRCSIIRFSGLSIEAIKGKLQNIATKEQIKCNESVIENIATTCNGDLRKAIGYLQTVSLSVDEGEEISLDILEHLIDKPLKKYIDELLELFVKKKYKLGIEMCLELIEKNGYTTKDIVEELIKSCERYKAENEGFDENKRYKIMQVVSNCYMDIHEKGNNNNSRLVGCLCEIGLSA